MTHTMTMRAAWLGALVGLAGCAVVSRQHLDDLQGGADAGPRRDGEVVEEDAGGPQFDDRCKPPDETPRFLLTTTNSNIEIDTTGYENDSSSSCMATTEGNDIFIGLDVTNGARWHFHLSNLSGGDRKPMLYLTEASRCDSRTCTFSANACSGGGEEHFAFEANVDGRWYLGIDDSEPGGGRYRLAAYRLVCADGSPGHGEGCDDGNRIDGDGCDRDCRVELSTERIAEFEPNDNALEANAIVLPPSNELEITGSIGGTSACLYADVFAINVPAGGDLEVDALNADGTPCASGASTMFELVLQSGSDTLESGMQDANGCAIVRHADLEGAEYTVRVQVPAETTMVEPYRLRFRILP
jgi:cysteine-rich repeat protein